MVDMPEEDWDSVIAVHLKGHFSCSQAAAREMIKQNSGGRIINVSSVAGFAFIDVPLFGISYATAKAGVVGFTGKLNGELSKYGITVNAICPGYVLTPMVQHSARESNPTNPGAVIDGIGAGVPMGRLGNIEEIGDLAAFLASDESRYITGTQVVIDGGSTLPETMAVGV